MSGLTQRLDAISLASQGDIDTQSTIDGTLDNTDAARLLQSVVESISHEDSQSSILAERGSPEREYPISNEGNDDDRQKEQVEPTAEVRAESQLPERSEDNSQQTGLQYTQYLYALQMHGYPMPSSREAYPAMQHTQPQYFHGQTYPGDHAHQYPTSQYSAYTYAGPQQPAIIPQYPSGQLQYACPYPQVHHADPAVPAAQPAVAAGPRNTGRPRRNNNKEGKHPCQVCGRKFLRPSSLLTHMRVHSHEKPFPCRFAGCPRMENPFSVKSNRTRHENNHIEKHHLSIPPDVLLEVNATRVRNGQPLLVGPAIAS